MNVVNFANIVKILSNLRALPAGARHTRSQRSREPLACVLASTRGATRMCTATILLKRWGCCSADADGGVEEWADADVDVEVDAEHEVQSGRDWREVELFQGVLPPGKLLLIIILLFIIIIIMINVTCCTGLVIVLLQDLQRRRRPWVEHWRWVQRSDTKMMTR